MIDFLLAGAETLSDNPHEGYFLGKDLRNDRLLIRCPLQFDQGVAEWDLKFYDLTISAPNHPMF